MKRKGEACLAPTTVVIWGVVMRASKRLSSRHWGDASTLLPLRDNEPNAMPEQQRV